MQYSSFIFLKKILLKFLNKDHEMITKVSTVVESPCLKYNSGPQQAYNLFGEIKIIFITAI